MRHTSQTATTKDEVTTNKTPREILPVLVPAAGELHDGVANFYLITERQGTGTVSRSGPKVRLLRNRDISEQAIRKVLSSEDYDLLMATLDLKKSRETNDPLLSERAYKKLMPRLHMAGVDPKVFSSYAGWAHVHVPQLATAPMEEARLVLWWSGKFTPAIYCPNLRTAIFVRAFLSLQTCPHCGILFVPEKDNVIYCRPSHGHAHRMARSRYLKAIRAKKKKRQASKRK